MENLEKFIVRAKANGWVEAEPGGKKTAASRLGSFDISFEEGEFFYQDSFVGLSDFCGQEHICFKGELNHQQCSYRDANQGDFKRFHGKEEILLEGAVVYELRYFGGLVRK